MAKEASYEKHFQNGSKQIENYSHLFKICGRIQAVAISRFNSILRIKMGGEAPENVKTETNGESNNEKGNEGEVQKEENEKVETKNSVEKFPPNEKIAAYSLYSACFQN